MIYKRFKLVIWVVFTIFAVNASFGYQVWFGLPYIPTEAQYNLDQWDLMAAQVQGLNLNPSDTQLPDEDRNSTSDWRAIVQAMPNAKDNAMIGFPRTHFDYANVDKGTLEEVAAIKFRQEQTSKLNATIKWVMPFDNQPGEDRTKPTYEWTDAELQQLREWLNSNGHADVKLLSNVRNYTVRSRSFAQKAIVAGVSIEAKAELWYGNKGSRQDFLKWAVADPLTKDKNFKFQVPFGTYNEESAYQAMRGFMRWLSSDLLKSTELVRREDTVFLVIVYSKANQLPEMSDDGTEYKNTLTSLALSIIEQKAMFEGTAPGGLITKAQTMSYKRGTVEEGPTEGLVAHWPLDEGTGSVASDVTENGFDGELLNGATWGSDAERGTYAVFDGTNDCISTTFTYALHATNNFTWAWWAKSTLPAADATQKGAIMVGNRYPDRTSPKYGFIKMTPQGAQFANTDRAGTIAKYDYTDISQNDWHHYAMVKDGTSYQWYVDGVAQGAVSNFNYSETSSIPFFIGGDGDNKPNEYFKGFIDDVILYREALTAEEVHSVKNEVYPYTPLTYELIAGWEQWSNTTSSPSIQADGISGHANNSAFSVSKWGASTDGSFGALAEPAASTSSAVNADGLRKTGATDISIDFTVENSSARDVALGTLYFDAMLKTADTGPKQWSLQVLSGSITTGEAGHAALQYNKTGSDLSDYEVDLSARADHTLDAGEQVVFRLSFTGGDAGNTSNIDIDNVALSGSFLASTAPVDPPTMLVEQVDGTFNFSWSNSTFKLQYCTNLADGAWTDYEGGAASPVTVNPTNSSTFFRLIEQ